MGFEVGVDLGGFLAGVGPGFGRWTGVVDFFYIHCCVLSSGHQIYLAKKVWLEFWVWGFRLAGRSVEDLWGKNVFLGRFELL